MSVNTLEVRVDCYAKLLDKTGRQPANGAAVEYLLTNQSLLCVNE